MFIFSETSVCQLPSHGVNLHGGSNVLCPGEIGLFECVLTDSATLLWEIVVGSTLVFVPTHEIGSGPLYDSKTSSVAFLTGHSDTRNRTSILRYVPERGTMNTAIQILCYGDGANTRACIARISIAGVL